MAVNEPDITADPWAALKESVGKQVGQAAGPAVANALGTQLNQLEARVNQYAESLARSAQENQAPVLARLDVLEGQVLTKGEAAAESIVTDTVVRFHANKTWELALGILAFGAVVAGGLIVLVEYLNGNPRAADIKDAAGVIVVPILYHLYLHFTAPQVPISTALADAKVAMSPAQASPVLVSVEGRQKSPVAPHLVEVTDTGTPPPLPQTS